MKAKTITELVAEHRDVLQMLTQQIGELNIRVNERDAEIAKLKKELEATHRKASHGCYDFHCPECD